MTDEMIPVRLPDGSRLLLRAERTASTMSGGSDDEQEIAGRLPDIDQVTAAVGAFTERIGAALKRSAPTRFTVEFECEIGFDSGGLVAIVGKGSAKSAFRVVMEWEKEAGPAGPG
ncbi:CU044_2847 family protein [Streptomyces sp. NBC_00124]|uniref:CU044_2847 family protein n=1 Tax=Streptomyces sp. NBC_00124 TaxID=2975662 RepID=UPI00225255D5|nr:CU044_2847 family protein [Streptomyces sp. NBC_00124]MCX5364400.1 CU044_2847 family protein [Streptomyces sp. NBC_00124]